MREKFIRIAHPDREGVATVAESSFEKVWKDKGFEIVGKQTTRARNKPLDDEPVQKPVAFQTRFEEMSN